MKLHGAAAIAFAALLLLPFSAFAADAPAAANPGAPTATPGDSSPGSGTDNASGGVDSSVNPFLPGEQSIGLAAGLHIPTFLLPVTGKGVSNLDLGGSFSLSYQYFISRGLALGGSISGALNGTIGGSSLFTAPLGVSLSYWWAKLPFEFDVLAEAGGYIMHYVNDSMIDPFAKAGLGIYWRATASWSIGLQANFWFIPEFHYGADANLTQYGGFVDTAISAVYHI